MDEISIKTVQIGMGIAKTFGVAIKKTVYLSRLSRFEAFIEALEVSIEYISEVELSDLHNFIEDLRTRQLIVERAESIISTDSKLIYIMHALLLCRQKDVWCGENIEKRLIMMMDGLYDEHLEILDKCFQCKKVRNDISPYELRRYNENENLKFFNGEDIGRVVTVINDLIRKGVFIPDVTTSTSTYASASPQWQVDFGISDEARALRSLYYKAKLITEWVSSKTL
ncbi:hypothetical protein SAMN02745753_03713 [Marinomonas polaris DSM 16579]|uniref:Uncharacterized protein n=1 Tax=Marinomonas polaris DSM 16579 TaxID=1122206 RepID=A0A1M5IZM3_9GAMM|nr:hypothetical protein [Marinomonas polaris]SHG33420.1 hypothetical protein SAMN02745753_03713 [Marinomonas polaris DSM 16579]